MFPKGLENTPNLVQTALIMGCNGVFIYRNSVSVIMNT